MIIEEFERNRHKGACWPRYATNLHFLAATERAAPRTWLDSSSGSRLSVSALVMLASQ